MTNALTRPLLASTLIATAFALAANALAAPVTEQRSVGAFSAVDVSGPYKVLVRAQSQQAVSVTGEAKELAEIETLVRGNTLVVRPRQRKSGWLNIDIKREHATVTIAAPMITKVRTGTSRDTTVEQIGGERFELVGEGPGDIHAGGSTRSLVVASRGPGDMHLERLAAVSLDLTADGPGDIAMGKLAGGDATVSLNGPGNVNLGSVNVGKLTTRLRGPGDLRLAGSSRELRAEVDGPGDFHGCAHATAAVHVLMRGPGDACVNGVITRLEAESHGPGDLKVTGLQAPSAKVQVHGPGSIELKGSVETLSAQVSGPGKLDGQGLTAGRAEVAVHGPGGAQVNLRQAGGGVKLAKFSR